MGVVEEPCGNHSLLWQHWTSLCTSIQNEAIELASFLGLECSLPVMDFPEGKTELDLFPTSKLKSSCSTPFIHESSSVPSFAPSFPSTPQQSLFSIPEPSFAFSPPPPSFSTSSSTTLCGGEKPKAESCHHSLLFLDLEVKVPKKTRVLEEVRN